MDEVLFRSSQKIESLQVQLELAFVRSKDILYNYSELGKSLILRAWHNTRLEQIKQYIKEICAEIVTVSQEIQYRIMHYVDPRRLYSKIVQLVGKKLNQREIYICLVGFMVGGVVGIVVGLAIRRKENAIHYMQAIQVNNFQGIESACIIEDAHAPYQCDDHEVLVNVKAASVQSIDAQICSGYGKNLSRILRRIFKQPVHPVILGRDCTGIITDLGSKVKRLEIGDEVWVTVPYWCQGTMCQTILVSEHRVSRKPKSIGFEGACSLPYAGCSALAVLQQAGLSAKNSTDKRILVQGGCTPIGCVLIQILTHWGAIVTTTCHKRAVPVAQALGAEDIVTLPDCSSSIDSNLNVDDKELLKNVLVKELELKGAPFDFVIITRECNLGVSEFQSLLAHNGIILSTIPPEFLTDLAGFPLNGFLSLYIRLRYILMKLFGLSMDDFDETHLCYVSLDTLAELVEDGHLQTVVEKVFHPQDIELALNHIQSTRAIGSSVITFR